MLDLLVHILGFACLLITALVLVAAVVLNFAGDMHSACEDVEARQRAEAQEGLARHELYGIPPADRRVDNKSWRRSA